MSRPYKLSAHHCRVDSRDLEQLICVVLIGAHFASKYFLSEVLNGDSQCRYVYRCWSSRAVRFSSRNDHRRCRNVVSSRGSVDVSVFTLRRLPQVLQAEALLACYPSASMWLCRIWPSCCRQWLPLEFARPSLWRYYRSFAYNRRRLAQKKEEIWLLERLQSIQMF